MAGNSNCTFLSCKCIFKKNKCKIVAFESYSLFHDNKNNFLNKIKWNIGKLFKIKNFGVYSSFGVTDVIKPKYDSSLEISSLKKVEKFFKKKKNLRDLENFRIENIWIGDLIYDSYLKKFSNHTIDLDSKKFKLFFFECLCNFHFWSKYFKKNNIKGIAVGHSVYVSGIPLRIADYYNISNFSFEGSNFVNGTGRTSFKKEKIIQEDILDIIENYLKNLTDLKLKKYCFRSKIS